MTPSRIRKLNALTRGAAILSIGVGGCAKSEPVVSAPETQASAVATTSSSGPAIALPPRVVLNAPPQIPSTDDDSGVPQVRRLNTSDGGRRIPTMNAPPHQPPSGSTP